MYYLSALFMLFFNYNVLIILFIFVDNTYIVSLFCGYWLISKNQLSYFSKF